MSDISAALQLAIATSLRGDAAVMAAFATAPVKIYDVVPDNAPEPYLQIDLSEVLPIAAEGFNLSESEASVHIWSRPAQPGLGEAQAMAPAVAAVLAQVSVPAGGRVYAALPVRTSYLRDPSDPRLIHAVVTFRFTTAPA